MCLWFSSWCCACPLILAVIPLHKPCIIHLDLQGGEAMGYEGLCVASAALPIYKVSGVSVDPDPKFIFLVSDVVSTFHQVPKRRGFRVVGFGAYFFA